MTQLELINIADADAATAGTLAPAQVRRVRLEALVDTGATQLVLPQDVVDQLGVFVRGHRKVRLADGTERPVPWVGPLLIEILGRQMVGEALVMPSGTTALIGQIPLENLDLVVDPKSREVRVNPASPDAPLLDLLTA